MLLAPIPSPALALALARSRSQAQALAVPQAVLEKAKQEALKEEFSGKERVFKMCALGDHEGPSPSPHPTSTRNPDPNPNPNPNQVRDRRPRGPLVTAAQGAARGGDGRLAQQRRRRQGARGRDDQGRRHAALLRVQEWLPRVRARAPRLWRHLPRHRLWRLHPAVGRLRSRPLRVRRAHAKATRRHCRPTGARRAHASVRRVRGG